jgi:hypothetical protein
VSTARSTLCVYRANISAGWSLGSQDCRDFVGPGSHVCRHEEVRRACNTSGMALTTSTWMADRTGDDTALFTNSADCNNFDGEASALNGFQQGTYCCMEWMKY